LGGHLDVISRAGQGTVVGLSIPRAMHASEDGP
jgi:chemotaxis protein histidine kinase CheA